MRRLRVGGVGGGTVGALMGPGLGDPGLVIRSDVSPEGAFGSPGFAGLAQVALHAPAEAATQIRESCRASTRTKGTVTSST